MRSFPFRVPLFFFVWRFCRMNIKQKKERPYDTHPNCRKYNKFIKDGSTGRPALLSTSTPLILKEYFGREGPRNLGASLDAGRGGGGARSVTVGPSGARSHPPEISKDGMPDHPLREGFQGRYDKKTPPREKRGGPAVRSRNGHLAPKAGEWGQDAAEVAT